CEYTGNRIGRVTTSGTVTEYSTGITVNSGPEGITSGPGGKLWFTEYTGNRIGTISPTNGRITEVVPLPNPGSEPDNIVTGPDHNLWFTEYGGSRIGRLTKAGTLTEFALPYG